MSFKKYLHKFYFNHIPGWGGYFARGYVPCLKTRILPTYGLETPYSFLTFIMQHFSQKNIFPHWPFSHYDVIDLMTSYSKNFDLLLFFPYKRYVYETLQNYSWRFAK